MLAGALQQVREWLSSTEHCPVCREAEQPRIKRAPVTLRLCERDQSTQVRCILNNLQHITRGLQDDPDFLADPIARDTTTQSLNQLVEKLREAIGVKA